MESMPQHRDRAPTTGTIEPFSPLIEVPLKRGISDLLARQQEEYDEYRVKRTSNEMPPGYVVRLQAAQQAARHAGSSTRSVPRPQYPYWPTMWVAVAVVFLTLLFLKTRYS